MTKVTTQGGAQTTALALPPDIRAELLKAQGESISTMQPLPQIRVMAAGAGLFEFKDTNDTAREFEAIILGAHAQNVLWDRDADEEPESDDQKRPACSSRDGKTGIPREGFAHVMLNGAKATGNERIDCTQCRYNKFGSGDLLIPKKNKKGKAVTNQKMVYLLVPGRETPMELVLNAMSLKNYDSYASAMLNAGVPTQAVVTRISQKVQQGKTATVKYGVVNFARGESLSMDDFNKAVEKRAQYIGHISPVVEELVEAEPDEDTRAVAAEDAAVDWLDENQG